MKTVQSIIVCAALAWLLSGCASATRYSIAPEEKLQHFVVKHSVPKSDAFNKTEVALAEAYRDLPRVLKLRQPESGTFVLGPRVSYQVGGPLGPIEYAPYKLKIVVGEGSTSLDFDLSPSPNYNAYAPKAQIPHIHQEFRSVANLVAMAVGGTLQESR